MRYLYFASVRGDLQEGHVYGKRLPFSLPDANPYPFEHKIGVFVLCLVGGWAMTEASTRLCGLRADVC